MYDVWYEGGDEYVEEIGGDGCVEDFGDVYVGYFGYCYYVVDGGEVGVYYYWYVDVYWVDV